jgi:hypothetical protein
MRGGTGPRPARVLSDNCGSTTAGLTER